MKSFKKLALVLTTCILFSCLPITGAFAEATLLADWGDMSQAKDITLAGPAIAQTGDYRLLGDAKWSYHVKTVEVGSRPHYGLCFFNSGYSMATIRTADGNPYVEALFDAFSNSFTFETWIKMDLSSDGAIFELRNDNGAVASNNNYGGLYSTAQGGKQNLIFRRKFNSGFATFTSSETFTAGDWHHIVCSYDSSSAANLPTVVVDGKPYTMTVTGTPPFGEADVFTSNMVNGEEKNVIYLGQAKYQGAASFLKNAYYSELRIYSGKVTEEWAASQYQSLFDYFMPNYTVTFNQTENISGEKTKALQEGAFNLSIDVLNVSTDGIGQLITFKSTETGETVFEGTLSGSNFVFQTDFLEKGEYELFISKEIMGLEGKPYRNADKQISFSVSEDTAHRERCINEINSLLADTNIDDETLLTQLLTNYNYILKLSIESGSDYSKIINKEQIVSTLRQKTDYADVAAFAEAFRAEIVLQKDRDVESAIAELNNVKNGIETDKVALMKSILFTKYQTVFQLDTAEYDALQNKDAVIQALIAVNAQSVEQVADAFRKAVEAQKHTERSAEFFARLKTATPESLLADLTAYTDIVELDITDAFFAANQTAVLKDVISSVPQTVEALEKAFYGSIVLHGFNQIELGDRDSISLILNSYQGYWNVPAEYTNLTDEDSGLEVLKQLSGVKVADLDELSQKVKDIIKEMDKKDDEDRDNRPSRGNGSGGGGGFALDKTIPVTQIPATPVESKLPFTDIENVDWAKEGIRYLYDLGVVAGRTEESFAPLESVTRNEIAKMLSLTFNIKSENTEKKFDDVSKEHWAFNYVLGVNAVGIMQGKEETLFDGNAPLTRAEFAVIAKRLMDYKSISAKLDEEKTVYADDAFIPDYAKEAVYEMKTAGILVGGDDNRFAPSADVTRAAAAKVIHLIAAMKTGGTK